MVCTRLTRAQVMEEGEEEKKGGGAAVFGKDRKLKTVELKKGRDNGTTKLQLDWKW